MSGSVNAVYRESGTDLQAMFDEASNLHVHTLKQAGHNLDLKS